jgi:hypothetical protein
VVTLLFALSRSSATAAKIDKANSKYIYEEKVLYGIKLVYMQANGL